MNQKQGGSSYLKSEEQTLWGRNKTLRKNEPPTEVSAFCLFSWTEELNINQRDAEDQMLSSFIPVVAS